MYGVNVFDDVVRAARATLTNQLAKFAPGLYLRVTGQTGRGAEPESAEDIAAYFRTCLEDYFRELGVPAGQQAGFLLGKQVLEYGPGDVPGVALLMLASGAETVCCADRFPMISFSGKNVEVLQRLCDGLPEPARSRAAQCFREAGRPASGFREERLRYVVQPDGLSGLRDFADLVISRAVLEHVSDLQATFADMRDALRAGGVAIHQVDLRSHGLHRVNALEFLTWPAWLWSMMYDGKGVPNRWRVDRYREVLAEQRFKVTLLKPTALAQPREIEEVRPHLAAQFRALSDEDLSWLGFWLVCGKPATA